MLPIPTIEDLRFKLRLTLKLELSPAIFKRKGKSTRDFPLVSHTGLEPVTPALSRQCSKPTELMAQKFCNLDIANFELQKYHFF